MKGDITFLLVIASLMILTESYVIHTKSNDKNDYNKHTLYSMMDGYKPFVTRPRYGFGKRSEENTYEELKELSNDVNDDEEAALILIEDDDDDDNIDHDAVNSDEQIPVIAVKSRRLLRQFGDEESSHDAKRPHRGRWGRFGGKRGMLADSENDPSRWGRFGKREIDEAENNPSRWGRFGKRDISSNDVNPSRWGRFGKRSEVENPSRWGRFGKRSESENPSRWGRFGKRSSGENPSRWGRFGDEMYVVKDEREAIPAQSRWGRFGKRAVIIVESEDELKK